MDLTTLKIKWTLGRQVVCLVLLTCVLGLVSGQIRYSIPEELEHGAFVGNIAEDLGLDVAKLSARRFRIVSGARKQYLEVNLENGILFVNEKIDREELCELSLICFLHLQVVIENPLELFRVEVEILDVNDNAPSFPWNEFVLEITESAAPGSRFPLESAQDPDVGTNSLRTYLLSSNEHFSLDIQTRSDGSKFAELVLETPLDREQQKTHQVVLTAVDGGMPERSGTAQITISVLDANDNVPVFDQSSYRWPRPFEGAGTLQCRFTHRGDKSKSSATPRNNAKGTDNLATGWGGQNHSHTVNKRGTPNEIKQPNNDWPLSKTQNSALKSYSSMNMDRTLIRKAIQRESKHFVAGGQYWTWGTHMRDYMMPSPAIGLTDLAWTPRYGPQYQLHPAPDYQHNVYIPGTPTLQTTSKPMQLSDLDIKNSFSTFGKKKKFTSNYDPKEDGIINNDLF